MLFYRYIFISIACIRVVCDKILLAFVAMCPCSVIFVIDATPENPPCGRSQYTYYYYYYMLPGSDSTTTCSSVSVAEV